MLRHIANISIITAALGAAGCAGTDANEKELAMGVILPLTGEKSEFAQNIRRGMELAQDEINSDKSNPKSLALVWGDTKGEITETQSIMRGFVQRDIKVIHAGFTTDIAYDLGAFGLLKDSMVNYLCTYPPAAVHSGNGLRIFLNGAQECEMLAKLIVAPKDADRKLMIMSVNDAAGKSCGDYLKFQCENPSLKIMSDTFKNGETRFDIFAEQISALKINYVLMYGYGDSAAHAVESLKKVGFEGVFASNCGFSEALAHSSETMPVYEIRTAFSLGKASGTASAKFAAAYEKKYGQKPHWTAAYGYDSVVLTWNAMKNNGFDAARARESLLDKTFEGAIGKISIDKLGDSTSELELVRN